MHYDHETGETIFTPAEKRKFAERLTKLADYLAGPVAAAVKAKKVQWDMAQWSSKKIKPKLSCGTAACAAGYATTLFSRQGFRLAPIWDGSTEFEVVFRGENGFEACFAFFGTEAPFDPDTYEAKADASIPTVVKELRKHARRFAAEAAA
jgi:hypothetical protein